MVGTHVFFLWRVRERIARGDPDFTVFYTAGKLLREGRGSQLYDPHTQQSIQREFTSNSDIRRGPLPYIHPPFEALVFLPLTWCAYPVAFTLWEVLNLFLLLAVARLLRESLPSLQRFSLSETWFACLAFFPIFATFHQGQDAILLLLVLVLGFRALDRNSDLTAGCWLGFGIFKYHLIFPLVLILALWKGKRLVSGFLLTACSLSAISLAIVGWSGALLYPAFTLRVVSGPAFGGIPLRQLANLLGLLTGWPLLENVGWPMQVAVALCIVALLAVVASLQKQAGTAAGFRLCLSCAVIAALLVGYNTNTYDLSLLILPVALVGDYCLRQPSRCRLDSSLMLPIIPLLISPLWFFLWMKWERINLIAVFLIWWLFAIRSEVLGNAETAAGSASGTLLK